MKYPPHIDIPLEQMPEDSADRHEFLADVFGKYLFWAINEARNDLKALVESSEQREKIGRVLRRPFEAAATQLNGEQQQIAFDLATEALSFLVKRLLAILTAQGISHRMGDKHAIQFRLILEIHEIEELRLVYEEVINRGGNKSFSSYWGRWLNQNTSKTDE